MNIANKTILITGANRGIGRAVLDEALRRGAHTVYAATRQPFHSADPRVIPLQLDVTHVAQIKRVALGIETLDVLVNNAGIAEYEDLTEADTIRRIFAVNVFGPLQLTQALLPQLRQAQGAVVNHLSMLALAPLPIIPAYSATNAALLSVTQSLRAQLTRHHVSVHGVILGPTDTDMNKGLDIPKASPGAVARAIFDGLANGEEEIFPDPASQTIAEGWRGGVAKALERQLSGFAPKEEAAVTA